MGKTKGFLRRNWEGVFSKFIYDAGTSIFLLLLSLIGAVLVSKKWDVLGIIPRVGEFWAFIAYLCMAIGVITILYQIGKFVFAAAKRKGKQSKVVPAWVINARLMERPHECTFCGFSYSVMPDNLNGDTVTYIKDAKCPHCGNVDVVSRFYGLPEKPKNAVEPLNAADGINTPKKQGA